MWCGRPGRVVSVWKDDPSSTLNPRTCIWKPNWIASAVLLGHTVKLAFDVADMRFTYINHDQVCLKLIHGQCQHIGGLLEWVSIPPWNYGEDSPPPWSLLPFIIPYISLQSFPMPLPLLNGSRLLGVTSENFESSDSENSVQFGNKTHSDEPAVFTWLLLLFLPVFLPHAYQR